MVDLYNNNNNSVLMYAKDAITITPSLLKLQLNPIVIVVVVYIYVFIYIYKQTQLVAWAWDHYVSLLYPIEYISFIETSLPPIIGAEAFFVLFCLLFFLSSTEHGDKTKK